MIAFIDERCSIQTKTAASPVMADSSSLALECAVGSAQQAGRPVYPGSLAVALVATVSMAVARGAGGAADTVLRETVSEKSPHDTLLAYDDQWGKMSPAERRQAAKDAIATKSGQSKGH